MSRLEWSLSCIRGELDVDIRDTGGQRAEGRKALLCLGQARDENRDDGRAIMALCQGRYVNQTLEA